MNLINNNNTKSYLCPLIVGILLIIVGLAIQIPGGALTTYSSFDGDRTDYYTFDNKYSSIDEYVGGDAYNYIIGASLVAGKTAGAMASKSIFIVGGAICVCFGLTLMKQQKNTLNPKTIISDLFGNNTSAEAKSIRTATVSIEKTTNKTENTIVDEETKTETESI